MCELAILGGSPTVAIEGPHYKWPPLTQKTEKAIVHQMHQSISIYNKSGIIDELEKRLSSYHGVKHALLSCTGTAGLHSAFVAASLGEGDEVICPAYTFHATVTPLFFTGAIPVLVDADQTGNIDPSKIEEKINSRTKAILLTHMWGVPCDMAPILAIAKKHHLLVIEDGSHAFGALYRGKKVGTFGDLAVFSMQGQKTLTAGEGGFLLSPSDELYYRAVLFGHYNKRCLQEIPAAHPLYPFGVTGMGLKLRIHPLAAAIANEQMDGIDLILKQRRSMAKKMISLFTRPGISVSAIPSDVDPSWYALILQYDENYFEGLALKKFHQALLKEGCSEFDLPGSTQPLNLLPIFQKPELLFPKYKGLIEYRAGDFPVAEAFYRNALKLPVWHDEKDFAIVEAYATAFEKVIGNYRRLL